MQHYKLNIYNDIHVNQFLPCIWGASSAVPPAACKSIPPYIYGQGHILWPAIWAPRGEGHNACSMLVADRRRLGIFRRSSMHVDN